MPPTAEGGFSEGQFGLEASASGGEAGGGGARRGAETAVAGSMAGSMACSVGSQDQALGTWVSWQRGTACSQCHLHQRDTSSVTPAGSEAPAQTKGLAGSRCPV